MFFPVSDVKQDMLETIVPKSEYDLIMVVLGEHRGQVCAGVIAQKILRSYSQLPCALVFKGWAYSSTGQEQVQGNGAAGPLRGKAVHIRL